MPNPEICDKCWEEYWRIEDAPGAYNLCCSDLDEWFCPDMLNGAERLKREAPAPKNCPKLFEQSVAEGMKNDK